MDDDTIPEGSALEELFRTNEAARDLPVGFIGSKVLWTNGSPHLMNIPLVRHSINNYPFNLLEDRGILIIQQNSFVSFLINSSVVSVVGLPFSEYFIWGDDVEYSERIVKSGFVGLYARRSVVIHKTKTCSTADIIADSVENAFKHYYGVRNHLATEKRSWKIKYFLDLIKSVIVTSILIMIRRKDHRLKFALINVRACAASITFHPSIEHIEESCKR